MTLMFRDCEEQMAFNRWVQALPGFRRCSGRRSGTCGVFRLVVHDKKCCNLPGTGVVIRNRRRVELDTLITEFRT